MARSKTPKMACPQCGAKNEVNVRRCRVCTAIINKDAEDLSNKPKGLPDHIQRQVDKSIAAKGETSGLPTEEPAFEPPPAEVFAPAPPDSYEPAESYEPTGSDESWDDGGFGISIDVAPRHPGVAVPVEPPAPEAPIEDEVFDPNALFADMDPPVRPDLPPPPPPSPSRELVWEPVAPVDPFEGIGEGVQGELTSEQIDAMTEEAIRQERMGRRPKLLGKLLKEDEDPPADSYF